MQINKKIITFFLLLAGIFWVRGGVLADCNISGTNFICNIDCPTTINNTDTWLAYESTGGTVDCCDKGGAVSCNPNGGGRAGDARSFYNAMLSTNGVAPGAGVTGSSAGGTVTLVPPITSGGAGLGLEGIIAKVMGFIFWLGAVVCPILIVWGGFNIATAGDDQNKMSTGKQTITYAIVGLLIIAVSAALANAIKYILQ